MWFHWKFIKVFQEKLYKNFTGGKNHLESKIAEIEATLNDGDQALYENIRTVELNLESVKNGMTDKIEQVQVSFNKSLNRVIVILSIGILQNRFRLVDIFLFTQRIAFGVPYIIG